MLSDEDLNQISKSIHKLQKKIDAYKERINGGVLEEEVELGPDVTLNLDEQKNKQKLASDAVVAYYNEHQKLTTDRNANHFNGLNILGVIIAYDHIENKKHSIIWCSLKEWNDLKEGTLKQHLRYLRWKNMEL